MPTLAHSHFPCGNLPIHAAFAQLGVTAPVSLPRSGHVQDTLLKKIPYIEGWLVHQLGCILWVTNRDRRREGGKRTLGLGTAVLVRSRIMVEARAADQIYLPKEREKLEPHSPNRTLERRRTLTQISGQKENGPVGTGGIVIVIFLPAGCIRHGWCSFDRL